MKTALVRPVRVNQNSEVADCKTQTISGEMSKTEGSQTVFCAANDSFNVTHRLWDPLFMEQHLLLLFEALKQSFYKLQPSDLTAV